MPRKNIVKNKLNCIPLFYKVTIFVIAITTVYNCVAKSQMNKEIVNIDSSDYSCKKDSLLLLYGCNKQIISNFDLAVLIALSYFPELRNTNIVFKQSKIKTTMNTRPRILSLFKNRKKRRYIIRINISKQDSIVSLYKTPFNAQIGIIGHELSHCIDYSGRNFWGIMKRLFDYGSKKSKAKFEREIDQITINRGLRWQLYDWANYVLYKSDATHKYKKFKNETYMKPEEIKALNTDTSKKRLHRH